MLRVTCQDILFVHAKGPAVGTVREGHCHSEMQRRTCRGEVTGKNIADNCPPIRTLRHVIPIPKVCHQRDQTLMLATAAAHAKKTILKTAAFKKGLEFFVYLFR